MASYFDIDLFIHDQNQYSRRHNIKKTFGVLQAMSPGTTYSGKRKKISI